MTCKTLSYYLRNSSQTISFQDIHTVTYHYVIYHRHLIGSYIIDIYVSLFPLHNPHLLDIAENMSSRAMAPIITQTQAVCSLRITNRVNGRQ